MYISSAYQPHFQIFYTFIYKYTHVFVRDTDQVDTEKCHIDRKSKIVSPINNVLIGYLFVTFDLIIVVSL